jgi:hypothetical protein
MNAEKNNIDNYFKERLFEYETNAPADVWNKIDENIRQKKSKVIWRISISFAASIAIIISLFTGYYFGIKHSFSPKEKIVKSINNSHSEKPTIQRQTYIQVALLVNKNISKETHGETGTEFSTNKINTSNTTITPIAGKTESVNIIPEKAPINKTILEEYHFAFIEPKNPVLKNFSKSQKLALSEENINFALGMAEIPEKAEDDIETIKNIWIVNGNASPLYSYRNIQSNNSNVPTSFYNGSEKPILAYSGGLNVAIEIHRWRFESGIYYSKSGQDVGGVYAFVKQNSNNQELTKNLAGADGYNQSFAANSSQRPLDNNSNGYLKLTGSKLSNTITYSRGNYYGFSSELNNSTITQANVEQRYKYIEIPVIAYYKLIDRKTDLSITGGLSTNILVGNDAIIKNSDNSFNLGPTQGVEHFNFAGIIGLAFEMPVIGHLSLQLEPRLKYFINSLNTNDQISTHPYSIGFFSGISYRF